MSQRHGSGDPDPDPPQNVMDPQHWLEGYGTAVPAGGDGDAVVILLQML
jgi:hypothetical protein